MTHPYWLVQDEMAKRRAADAAVAPHRETAKRRGKSKPPPPADDVQETGSPESADAG